MTPDSRRLLRQWLEAEDRGARPLSQLLAELSQESSELRSLGAYLQIKEKEDKARQAVLDRERWFRTYAWRMVSALFGFGVVGLAVFAVWGGEEAFRAALFFVAGGACYYLLAQAMTSYRARRDRKALEVIRQRCREELAALARELAP